MKKEGDSLIKPSEYLKSLTSRGASLPRFVDRPREFNLFSLVSHFSVNIQILRQVVGYYYLGSLFVLWSS